MSIWKEYYRARNYVYIYKTYYGKARLLKHIIYVRLNSLFYKEDKKRKQANKRSKDDIDYEGAYEQEECHQAD